MKDYKNDINYFNCCCLSLLLFLSFGCTSVVERGGLNSVEFPISLVSDCPSLEKIEDGSIKGLVLAIKKDRNKYKECSKKHKDLIDFINQEKLKELDR